MAAEYKWCIKCGEQVSILNVFECPTCKGSAFTHNKDSLKVNTTAGSSLLEDFNQVAATPKSKNNAARDQSGGMSGGGDFAELIRLQHETIRATNRTTHAVRAFVLFIFYQLTATTLAGFVYGLGLGIASASEQCQQYQENCEINGFFIFTSIVILLGGIVLSSMKGWEEIGKSEL